MLLLYSREQSFAVGTNNVENLGQRVLDTIESSDVVVESERVVHDHVGKNNQGETIINTGEERLRQSWIQRHEGNLPAWAKHNSYGERLVCDEWELAHDRAKNGWRGYDFMHDDDAPVQIVEYFSNYGAGDGNEWLNKGGEGTTLTGIVHFSARAESHQGLCHGGSITAVMDDVVGWAAFLATGSCQPWSGFTVQINTALRKPIPIDSWLIVRGTISKIEGRKVSVVATITDPANDNAVHAEGDGLVVLNTGVLPGT